MPHWKYRDAWNRDYLAFRKKSAMSVAEIAEHLGRSVNGLNSYRRKGDNSAIPPEEVIRKGAALFGTNPFDYMDDPRVAEGLGLERYAALPQWKKDILQRNARAMDRSNLSPEQWEILQDAMIAQARTLEVAKNSGKKK